MVKRSTLLTAAAVFVLLSLGVAGCSSASDAARQNGSTSVGLTTSSTSDSTLSASDAPPCLSRWLSVSMSSAKQGGSRATRRFDDTVTVTTTHECELHGWPRLEQAIHVKVPTGATPPFITRTTGHSRFVILSPGVPATASVTVLVPKSWIWGGGNLCASFPSALVRLDGVSKAFFVKDVPTTTVSCGGSAPFHVTVGPFSASELTHLVAVPFGDVQLAVPGAWWVQIPGSSGICTSQQPPGELLLGNQPPGSCGSTVMPANIARIRDITRVPPKYAHKPTILIHGVRVIPGPEGPTLVTYYVPKLLEEVVAQGPLAHEIAGTLRFSPRLTTLGKGPVEKPTASWHLVNWQGLAAWFPRSWTITYTDVSDTPVCGTDVTSLPSGQVLFDSDKQSVFPPCPLELPTAEALFGSGGNGLRMDLHPGKTRSGRAELSRSCLHVNQFNVCPYGVPRMGVLEVLVTGGDLHSPRLVWIGLSGSGETARTVLHSLTMVAHPLGSA